VQKKIDDAELMAAVDDMRMDDDCKAALRAQLRAGEPHARFAVFAWIKRNRDGEVMSPKGTGR
jgi:hypothetical protein